MADVYFAFPPQEDQFTACDWSKYALFETLAPIKKDEALLPVNVRRNDTREAVQSIAQKVRQLVETSKIAVPSGIDLEISHHYGLEKFEEVGLTLLTVVNRAYCKKLLVSLPGQRHPEQYHKQKEETFLVLFGELHILLDGRERVCNPGDVVNIEPGVRHAFVSPTGAVIEEISSTHFKDDSYYTDESIMKNKNRKTYLKFWMD
jgi:D-lyxose ketol-isomerase